MNAFKKSIKGEFDKVVSRIPMPELIDYTAEAERLQKYRIEKEQVTNQIKQAIVKKNERKLSKEKLQSIYDIDLKAKEKSIKALIKRVELSPVRKASNGPTIAIPPTANIIVPVITADVISSVPAGDSRIFEL